jgi:molybdopterin molybdotransferase
MISVQEAQQLIISSTQKLSTETVQLENAFGRILAEDILADRDYPPFNRAAMDGYAFRFSDYEHQSSNIELTIAGELYAGHVFDGEIKHGECLKIMTGAATPSNLDCIVQVELAIVYGNKVTFPEANPKHWQNIARKGEDCKESDIVLKKNTFLSPTEMATLAVLGKKEIQVCKLPKVAIISTGDELVAVGEPVNAFQIRDSNAFALLAFFQSWNIPVTRREIVQDNTQALSKLVSEVLDFDIIVLSGGVSMGAADYVPKILAENGVRNIFHKLKLKPGKPLWFGQTPNGGTVFGLPGNPLSAQVCFKLFIETHLRAAFELNKPDIQQFPIAIARKKKVKLDEYFPVKLSGGELFPIQFNGSGDVTSTVGSTGIALHSMEKEDLIENELIEYINWI